MTGKVASGKWRASTRLYDHHLGSSGMTDPETWKVQNTGKFWGINLPGMGTVFHESGNWRGNVAVYLPEKEVLKTGAGTSAATWCSTTTNSVSTSAPGQRSIPWSRGLTSRPSDR